MKLDARWFNLSSLGVLQFLASLFICAGWIASASPAQWVDPPSIDMQDCIQAQRTIAKNPFSDAPNDFALVTMFVEQHTETEKTPDKAFYLVTGVLLNQEQQIPKVYFTALIVNISQEDHDLRRVFHWLLADTKSDGKLDKAIFREKEVSSSGAESVVSELHATEEQIESLQVYYKEAVRNLNLKADSNLPEECQQKISLQVR